MEIGWAWFLMWPLLLLLAVGSIVVRLTAAAWCVGALYALIRKRPVGLKSTLAFALLGVGAALLSHSYGYGFWSSLVHEPWAPAMAALNLAQVALGGVVAGWALARDNVSGARPA